MPKCRITGCTGKAKWFLYEFAYSLLPRACCDECYYGFREKIRENYEPQYCVRIHEEYEVQSV